MELEGHQKILSSKRILQIIRFRDKESGLKQADICFPHLKEKILEIQSAYLNLISYLELEYQKIKDFSDQKSFAFKAKEIRCSGALFALRSGKVRSIQEFLQNMHIDSLYEHVDCQKLIDRLDAYEKLIQNTKDGNELSK